MTDFIITRPSRGSDTLHAVQCPYVHHRTTRQPLAEAALGYYPTLWRRVDAACVNPTEEAEACTQWDAARDEWEAKEAREKAEREAVDYANWLVRRVDELEYQHQFVPLRDALLAYFPDVRLSSDMRVGDWKLHPILMLEGVWHNPSFTLHHDRATNRLSVDRGASVDLYDSAEAYRYARALEVIENFVVKPY